MRNTPVSTTHLFFKTSALQVMSIVGHVTVLFHCCLKSTDSMWVQEKKANSLGERTFLTPTLPSIVVLLFLLKSELFWYLCSAKLSEKWHHAYLYQAITGWKSGSSSILRQASVWIHEIWVHVTLYCWRLDQNQASGALTCDDIRTKHEWTKEFEKCPKVNRGGQMLN